MAGNSFGNLFRITTFGESHGGAIGLIIDGCPAGMKLDESDIQFELDRRVPGQSSITTQRKESDTVQILSGTFEGKTIGTPIGMIVKNKDANSKDYEYLKDKFRPSHSDYTYEKKFGIRAWAGGGRASARETVSRVAAGAIAKKYLKEKVGIEILAYVSRVKDIQSAVSHKTLSLAKIENNIVRCPDPKASAKMIELIKQYQKDGNSVGGEITCVIKNVPVGLGEPVFDKLDAVMAHAMLSIPATKGFEIGSGFAGTYMSGLEHNDPFYSKKDGSIGTKTNNSGGIQGGISNGEDIVMRIAFKPTSTILQTQNSVNNKGKEIKLENVKGRHDPCVLPRAVPIVDAMAAIVLMDYYLIQKTQNL